LGAGLLLCLVALYYSFNPAYAGFFPQCPFWKTTGFLCPGCGSQRAIHALLHLDLVAAFKFNPLAIGSLPILLGVMVLDLVKSKSPFLGKLYRKVTGQFSVYSMVAVIVLFWIGRNL